MDKKKFTAFIVGVCLVSVACNLAHPVTPTLIVERGLDSSMFGVALAAMQCVYFLFAPFWGRICDYTSTRLVLLICCCGYAIGQFIFGSAQTEAAVLGGRMFAGMFTGGVFTAMMNYIVNTTPDPDQRKRYITTYATANNVFNAVGYFVGGMLGVISVETAFGVQVFMLVACGVFFRFFCLDDTMGRKKPEHKLTFKDANPFSVFISAKSFMTPLLLLLFATVAIGHVGQTAFEQVFNYYIKDQFNLSSAYNGIFKAVIAAGTFAINTTLVAMMNRKTDTNISFFWVIGASVIPVGLLLLFDSIIPFAACYVVFSVLAAARLTLLQSICSNKGNEQTSNRIMGFFQSMTALGSIFGAFFAGIMYENDHMSPFRFAFVFVALGAVLAVLYVTRYKKENK